MKTNSRKIYVENKLRVISLILILFIVLSGVNLVKIEDVNYELKKNNNLITEVYKVKAGDTLWSIASNYSSKKTDQRLVVKRIKDLNNVIDSKIYPNDTLYIPIDNI